MAEVGAVEPRPGQVRDVQAGGLKDRVAQVRPGQVGGREVGAVEVAATQLDLLKVAALQVDPPQVGAREMQRLQGLDLADVEEADLPGVVQQLPGAGHAGLAPVLVLVVDEEGAEQGDGHGHGGDGRLHRGDRQVEAGMVPADRDRRAPPLTLAGPRVLIGRALIQSRLVRGLGSRRLLLRCVRFRPVAGRIVVGVVHLACETSRPAFGAEAARGVVYNSFTISGPGGIRGARLGVGPAVGRSPWPS